MGREQQRNREGERGGGRARGTKRTALNRGIPRANNPEFSSETVFLISRPKIGLKPAQPFVPTGAESNVLIRWRSVRCLSIPADKTCHLSR
jgi:hypothetical protein